jgi:hypothetical protein
MVYDFARILAHPGHPEVVTHEGGHALIALAIVVGIALMSTAVYSLSRRVSLKSSARRNSSGTDARSGENRVATRS